MVVTPRQHRDVPGSNGSASMMARFDDAVERCLLRAKQNKPNCLTPFLSLMPALPLPSHALQIRHQHHFLDHPSASSPLFSISGSSEQASFHFEKKPMNLETQQQKHKLEQNSTNCSGTGVTATATSSPAFTSPDRQLQCLPDDSTFLNLYSAFSATSSTHLQTTIPSSASLPLLPSSLSNESMTISSTDRFLYLARLTLQYREMEDRYEFCLSNLREAMEEVESLRHEISRLRKANTDLAKQLNPSIRKQQITNTLTLPTPFSVINDLRRLNFEDSSVDTSPTSVLCNNRFPRAQRISLPKSISVRSNESVNSSASGQRIGSPALFGSQRVYVPGKTKAGEREQVTEPMEFEAYGQGMFKTELCNKWEETGACPYGDHCQFAHGIDELRPVIRHPRYKTEVCRMVLAGEACPYGHRCHFRHGLTPTDRGLLGHPGLLR